jgi:hypothetical protein
MLRDRLPTMAMDRVDLDRPPLRQSATRQATKGQSVWLEVQDHVMATQATHGLPHPPNSQADDSDCLNGSRDA